MRDSLSLNYRERIPVGETDAYASCPIRNLTFNVRCEKCGKEHSYRASDVLKFEMEPPESFTPHPLFAEGGTYSPAAVEPSNVSRLTSHNAGGWSGRANTDRCACLTGRIGWGRLNDSTHRHRIRDSGALDRERGA